jgi:hypothetical protein
MIRGFVSMTGRRSMRGLLMSALAASMLVAGVVAAIGQEARVTVTSRLGITPKKAGTKVSPTGIALAGHVSLQAPEETGPPLSLRGKMLLPRGVAYNGGLYPKCTAATLRREGGAGLRYCPRRSIMGSSGGHAYPTIVLEYSRAKITFVNGGARLILAHITFYEPAFVQETISIHVKRLRRSRRWAYELSFETPGIMGILAGVPIMLSEVDFNIGGRDHAPRYLETSGGCPKRGFMPYQLSFDYSWADGTTGTGVDRGRIACR